MIRKFGQRAAVAVAATALAASGSVLFGATALAGGHTDNTGGAGGAGGSASSACLIPVNVGIGALLGTGTKDTSQCNASAPGGAGGAGASY